MSDITERLRMFQRGSFRLDGVDVGATTHEAADEIERLRAALRLALEWDAYDSDGVSAVWRHDAVKALGGQP